MTNPVLFGEILALLAAFSGAVSSICLSIVGKRVNSSLLGFVRMIIVVPLMIGLALIFDGTAILNAPLRDLVFVSVSGIIGFFLTDIFMFRAYAVFGAQETMVVMCFTPVLSTILSIFIFSEVPSPLQFVGIAMTVVGIVIMVLQKDPNASKKANFLSYGFLCALLGAVFQSASDLVAKSAVTNLPYISVASLRGVAGLFAWLIYAAFTKETLFNDFETLKKPANFGLLCTSVVVSTWLGTTVAMGSLKYAPAGIATSLKQISPVMILPYDFFVLKKKSLKSVVGTLIAVAGVIAIFWK